MKVTQVSLLPTAAARAAGRPALTPELLAATGARYSRSNEGLEAILAKVDPANPDRSVDSIFRMVDYGHQSIADMAPAAMFIDGISIWLAYLVWSLCPTAGGQESSTRYIEMNVSGLPGPVDLGVPEQLHETWKGQMRWCFDAYGRALRTWEAVAAARPEAARIPKTLLADPSEKAQRQVARMKRNYGFDRARYFLPVAALTNVMLVMSARGWVNLCQHLLSHSLPEAIRLGERIRGELKLSAPRLVRHAVRKESIARGLWREFETLAGPNRKIVEAPGHAPKTPCPDRPPTASMNVMLPPGVSAEDLSGDLEFHDNRYAWIGEGLKRAVVRFRWEAVAMAEIRDLNRHRTGTKHCPLKPCGFYCALDQIPAGSEAGETPSLANLAAIGREQADAAESRLEGGDPSYIYSTMLGTQYPFEHVTTADKFLYEAELRTGTGAHYRYAKHLRDALALWYEAAPRTKGLVLEGSAEPE